MEMVRGLRDRLARRGWWVVVLGLVFILALALNIRQVYEEREVNLSLQRSNPWAAWQLEREYLQFMLALHRFEEEQSQAALNQLLVRYEILYSRPLVILNGPETAIVRSLPGVKETVQALLGALDEWEPALYRLKPGSSDAVAALHAELIRFEGAFGEISSAASVGPLARKLRQDVQEVQARSTWMQLVLVGTSAVLMLILAASVWRNRRLAATETRLRLLTDRANHALRLSEQRYRHLVENTDVVPYTLDLLTLSYSYVGPQAERLLGYPGGDWLKPEFWGERLHDDDRERAKDERLLGFEHNDDFNLDYRMTAADGRMVWIRDVMRVARGADGRLVGYGLLFDETQAKLRDRELAAAQKMEAIGQLTGGMAHDFNNLLTIIIGNLELLKLKLQDDATLVRLLDRALNGATRGARLTRQLLGFARQQPLEPQDFDAGELVGTTIDLMRRTLGEQIVVVTKLDEGLWPIYADASQVEAALTNLAINARDAMPKGGRIAVEAANRTVEDDFEVRQGGLMHGDYVMLSVSDNGTGIPPDVLPRIFEPFFTTKAHGKGTGLGLSMVFGFVRQSHGHIEIESELGRGTTVRLYLPRGRHAVRRVEAGPEERRAVPIAGARVLVVEDNDGVRETAVARLRDLGCTVVEADSGPLALEAIERNPEIDLLFTDIVMPGGMSGIELAEAARRTRPDLQVLFTTGFYDDLDEASRRTGQIGNVLPKPYTSAALERKLRAVFFGRLPSRRRAPRTPDPAEIPLRMTGTASQAAPALAAVPSKGR